MRSNRPSLLRVLALAGGLALFSWYLATADWGQISQSLSKLGGLAPLILLPYFCVYLVDAGAWRLAFPDPPPISFWTTWRIRWAGESVNNAIPTAYIGGEAVKVYLLGKHGIAPLAGTSAALISKTAQTIAQLIFIVLGSAILLGLAGGQPWLRGAMLFVISGGVLVIGMALWIQQRGLFAALLKLAAKMPRALSWLENHRPKLLEADRSILGFYQRRRGRFYLCIAGYFCGWLLDAAEVYLVAWLLDVPVTWPQALALEAYIGVAKALGMWIPGSLGVQESGIVLLAPLAGLPPGFAATYALIRRVREIAFVLVGFLLLYREGATLRTVREGAAAPDREPSNAPPD